MKRLVREHYGDDAADGFKASKLWLRHFARRFGISLRRKSNAKAEPVEVRLPKIKRWHARLRRRLKRGDRIDPVYGLMGEETDAWLEQPGNLERWTKERPQGGRPQGVGEARPPDAVCWPRVGEALRHVRL